VRLEQRKEPENAEEDVYGGADRGQAAAYFRSPTGGSGGIPCVHHVPVPDSKTVSQAKDAGITDQTFYRWRNEYGGLQIEQAKKLKDLQRENAQLRRAIADLTVEKQILKDIAEGNF
jgi:hypothetical protein